MVQSNCDITVQLSKTVTNEAKFLHLNSLFSALAADPDLALILNQPYCAGPQSEIRVKIVAQGEY